MALRGVFGRLEVTTASIPAQVAELVRNAPGAQALAKVQARARELLAALNAKEAQRETLISSLSSTIASEALADRALALVEQGATIESQEVRQQRDRETYAAVCDEIRVLRAAVEIANRKVGEARGRVSVDVNAGTVELERAIVSRVDAAIRALGEAVALEAALVAAYEDNGVSRSRFQPSGFRSSTYLDTYSTASTWRREAVRAALLDAEVVNAEGVA
jgi:hypothetical protein